MAVPRQDNRPKRGCSDLIEAPPSSSAVVAVSGQDELHGDELRVTEVFHSLQGESSLVGLPTVFIRLSGCPLRCRYCDTAYAFEMGKRRQTRSLLAEVAEYRAAYVTVTGGEPLAQPGCRPLLKALCDAGYRVSLETGGALSLRGLDPRVTVVMDIKTPDSGECERNDWHNLALLRCSDQVKLVICSEADYRWAVAILKQHRLPERVGEVLLSPCWDELAPRRLADWILRDRLAVRLQLQLHKLLWGDVPGR